MPRNTSSNSSKYSVVEKASLDQLMEEHAIFSERLARIAKMETPGANATVKRMARVARGEL
jgi:hypothetical protein